MNIILASQSPRRKELLDLMGLKYEVIVSNADETFEEGLTIEEQSKRLAYIKSKTVFKQTSGDRIVIGSDTMVLKDGKIYEKPVDNEDAKRMLKELKNSKVQAITSLAVLVQAGELYKEYIDYDIVDIYIKDMSDDEIDNWIKIGKPLDKAGAFAVQTSFCVFIEKIVGNHTTAIGLPTHKLYDFIKEYIS